MTAAGAAMVATAAQASAAQVHPSGGVTTRTLAAGQAEDGLRITARGDTEVVYRRITIEPGGSTGWHYHPGQLLAVVESGTLTRTLADCSIEVSRPGDTVLEPVGPRHPHIGRNLGDEPVVLYATYFMPAGSTHTITAPDPGCG